MVLQNCSELLKGQTVELCMVFIQSQVFNFLLLPYSHLSKHPLYNNTDRRYRINSGFELFTMFWSIYVFGKLLRFFFSKFQCIKTKSFPLIGKKRTLKNPQISFWKTLCTLQINNPTGLTASRQQSCFCIRGKQFSAHGLES